MKKILVVEDEINISKLICETLTLGEYAYDTAFDGEKAVEKVFKEEYDLILLDIMLPKLDGFTVMEKIKQKNIPIIFLSAKSDVSSKLEGLKNGGQDYITKPFEPLELLARIKLRMGKDENKEKMQKENYRYKDIIINEEEKIVYKDENKIALTPKEYDLLTLLVKNVGTALSRDDILNKIWNIDNDIETRTVDYHIGQLRMKLDLKEEIKTVNKIGYRLEKE